MVDVDAGLDALPFEEVQEVLGRDVPRRVRRERAAAETADGRVEHRRAALESSQRVRVPGVARVVEVAADRSPRALRPLPSVSSPRVGPATPIVSARMSVSGSTSATRPAISATWPASTSPSNGQPNATLDVTAQRIPSPRARGGDPARRRDGVLDRRALISLVERLRDTERESHLVEPGREKSLVTRARSAPGRPGPAPGTGRPRRRPPRRRPSAERGADRRNWRPRRRADRPRTGVVRAPHARRSRGPPARSGARRVAPRRTESRQTQPLATHCSLAE